MSKEKGKEVLVTGSAEEYHFKDFDWDDLRVEVESNPIFSFHLSPPPPFDVQLFSCQSQSESQSWSDFHSRHSSGKFFKERRYLLKEFPDLVSSQEQDYSKLLEVGCGNASTLIPIMRVNESTRTSFYACDSSVEALERATHNIKNANIQHNNIMERFHPFCCDISTTQFPKWLACDSCRNKQLLHSQSEINEIEASLGNPPTTNDSCCLGGMDFVTMVFTLSAIPPERMLTAVMECFSVLKPGGLLLFRDYGLYDMTMLRFEPEKRVGFRHYMRADGTLSYFFDLDGARNLFVGAGFTELELEYCCVKSVNRRKGKSMKRVWIHGKFQKPL